MYKVSVIVPIYNVEKYIEQCVNSITSQDLEEIEIILVNDGSTDNSYEIAKKLAKSDKRIKVINQQNKGVSAARNAGLRISKGEYISFIDPDDWVEKNYLFKMYTNAKKNQCDVIVCNYMMTDGKNSSVYKYPLKDNILYDKESIINDIAKKIISGNIKTTVWDKLYKREFLEKNSLRFNEKIVMFEDWYFFVDLCTHMNSFLYINENLYNYRMVNNSLSRKYYENFFDMIIEMNERKIIFMKQLQIYDKSYLSEMKNNFIDDIMKSINHVIYRSNESIKYKLYKIKQIFNNDFNNTLLKDEYMNYYLDNSKLNKCYAKIMLYCINKKRALLIYLFIIGYKAIKKLGE